MATRITNPAGSDTGTGTAPTDGSLGSNASGDAATIVGPPAPAAQERPAEDTPAQEDRPAMKDILGVQYTGPFDAKVFTVKDLQKLGVEDPQTDLRWDRDNNFVVPKTDLNAATVDVLIRQPNFRTV